MCQIVSLPIQPLGSAFLTYGSTSSRTCAEVIDSTRCWWETTIWVTAAGLPFS
jgi:hypothetical protein